MQVLWEERAKTLGSQPFSSLCVVCCGVVKVWCGAVWCGVVKVWCGVVWYGVVKVWCGVVWCGEGLVRLQQGK